ncbi:hypothetical protein VE02_06835 [Pseudogymnoascus sp. 03VT05]|nr:hypothetical protein VE02_06835 [Pseudogymnoascus sp. 03VT05]
MAQVTYELDKKQQQYLRGENVSLAATASEGGYDSDINASYDGSHSHGKNDDVDNDDADSEDNDTRGRMQFKSKHHYRIIVMGVSSLLPRTNYRFDNSIRQAIIPKVRQARTAMYGVMIPNAAVALMPASTPFSF